MEKQNRKTRKLDRSGAAAFLLLFAASAMLAISANGKPGQRRQAMRESQIRVMDIFAQNYGGADWSPVTSDLEAHPEDPSNATFMSIPLSLANVYLNETAGPVDVVTPGDSLGAAIRDSQIVAFYLSERYLWQFPSGSQCEEDDDDGNIAREPRTL